MRKSTFSSCINCIKWLHLMILHCIIKAKLQGSRWPTDAISPPKLVGKSVILTSSENKYWRLQSRAFFKSRELLMIMAISVKCLLFLQRSWLWFVLISVREKGDSVFSEAIQFPNHFWESWDYLFSKFEVMCSCWGFKGYFCRLDWRRRRGSEQEILTCCLSAFCIV